MKFILFVLTASVLLTSCDSKKIPGLDSIGGLSEVEKLQIVEVIIKGNFNPKAVVKKDECLLKYFDVSGSKSGDIVTAKVKFDEGEVMVLMLTGGKTEDPKYCEAVAIEMAKMRPQDHKKVDGEVKVNMVTGQKVK